MKNVTRIPWIKYWMATFALNFITLLSIAQDSSISTSSSTTSTTTAQTTWYTQPWAWVVGGAILILIIIALLRNNGSGSNGTTDRVTVTKTRTTE